MVARFCFITISAKASLPIPIAFAAPSCWILFILAKSAVKASWSFNSSANPARSLFNANVLALSKLSSFPSSISASNSAAIDSSKLSKLLAIASTPSKLVPNNFALVAAFANSLLLNPNDNLIALLEFATSFKISFTLTETLLCFIKELTTPTVLSKIPSVSLLCNLAKVAILAADSSDIPSLVVKRVNVSKVSPPKSAINPVSLVKATKLLFNFVAVILTLFESSAI